MSRFQPNKCTCMASGFCFFCPFKKKKKNLAEQPKGAKKDSTPEIKTWHPPQEGNNEPGK